MGFMTRCSVLHRHDVDDVDRAHDGTISDAAVGRWIARAISAYLDQCTRLHQRRAAAGLALVDEVELSAPAAALGGPPQVAVSASATEVFPTSFVIGVRIRAVGGDDALLVAASTIRLEHPDTHAVHPIDDGIRDELIALEHSARHFN
jgi:hypothetical protein